MPADKTLVCLRGGLGNQLFQLSYALHTTNLSEQIGFISRLGLPNSNKCDKPELYDLLIPNDYRNDFEIQSWLLSKLLNFSLGEKIKKRPSRYVTLIEYAASIFLFLRFKKWFRINSGVGVGYAPTPEWRGGILVNGYFQSFRWVSIEKLKDVLRPIDASDSKLQPYLDEVSQKRVLALHIRLGDYTLFDQFGVLSKEYYTKALTSMKEKENFDVIWLFSNDLEEAPNLIPSEYSRIIRHVSSDLTSVETLQVMRLAHSYIIGNSTFSWWGAMLSNTTSPSVIAPIPWFRNMNEPIDLIPPIWERMEAWKE